MVDVYIRWWAYATVGGWHIFGVYLFRLRTIIIIYPCFLVSNAGGKYLVWDSYNRKG